MSDETHERHPPRDFYDLPRIREPHTYVEYAVFEDRTTVGLGFAMIGSARTVAGAEQIMANTPSTVRPSGLPRTIRHRLVTCAPWQDTFPDRPAPAAYLSDAPLVESSPD